MLSEHASGDNKQNSQAITDYQILFIGNSHSSANGLPDLVTTLIETGLPDTTAHSGLAPGFMFLDERLNDGVTYDLLRSRAWTHVILQAQKYSSSGRYFYSTSAAQQWIKRVRAQSGRPILFPEWPRRGNWEEGQRIHDLHLSIAARTPACVAPIGLAWEEHIAKFPYIDLHAADGNHSNLAGALLTAYVIYEVTTGLPASQLPYMPSINISAQIQQSLREVSSEVVARNQAACPDITFVSGAGGESDAPSDPRIPTLSQWGVLVLTVSIFLLTMGRLKR